MFTTTNAENPETVKSITVLIYGQPDAGKTSLAATAGNVILLDFNKGAIRSAFADETVKIKEYSDISKNWGTFLKYLDNYDRIAVDTVNSLLEYIGLEVINRDPRLATNKLRWYGAIKDEFDVFYSQLKTLEKDIIFVAHDKETEENDVKFKRPLIMGGTKDKLLQDADFVGYLSHVHEGRQLCFNSTAYKYGKNCGKIPTAILPDYNNESEYFDGIMKTMLKTLQTNHKAQRESVEKIKQVKSGIDHIDKISDFAAFWSFLATFPKYVIPNATADILDRLKRFTKEFKTANEYNEFLNDLSDVPKALKRPVFEAMKECGQIVGIEYIAEESLFSDAKQVKEVNQTEKTLTEELRGEEK